VKSRRVFHTEGEVLVAYRQFVLQENDGADLLALARVRPGDVSAGGEGGVFLRSSANDHYPWVRVELWSSEPPRSPEDWEITQDDIFTVSATGRLDLTGLFGMESDASTITLPHLGLYKIRVYVRGHVSTAKPSSSTAWNSGCYRSGRRRRRPRRGCPAGMHWRYSSEPAQPKPRFL
jgi:hypothetical protein